MSTTYDLETVLREAIDARAAEVHTAIPAKVISYDAAKQVADVQPMVKDFYHSVEGALIPRSFPTLPSVPVAFLRGSGYFMTVPLAAGDTGMLIFSELPIDRWRSTGQESHPVNARRHGVGNAVFYPGITPRAKALTETGVSDHMVLGKEGGCQIHVKPAEVNLDGGPSATAVALAQLIETRFTALYAAIAAGFTGVGESTAASGTAAKAAFFGAFSSPPTGPVVPQPSVAAQKVKAT